MTCHLEREDGVMRCGRTNVGWFVGAGAPAYYFRTVSILFRCGTCERSLEKEECEQ